MSDPKPTPKEAADQAAAKQTKDGQAGEQDRNVDRDGRERQPVEQTDQK